jgi:hypothetical protein
VVSKEDEMNEKMKIHVLSRYIHKVENNRGGGCLYFSGSSPKIRTPKLNKKRAYESRANREFSSLDSCSTTVSFKPTFKILSNKPGMLKSNANHILK